MWRAACQQIISALTGLAECAIYALFVLRALIEQLADDGTLSKDQVEHIIERAKAISNSEYPTRSSKRGEDDILDDLKKALER